MKLSRAYKRWWLDLEVSPARLAAFRVAFFALVALDAWHWVAHAPRYGVGGFDVPNLPGLDLLVPGPSRGVMAVLFLLQSYLALRIVFGEVSRAGLAALAALFGYGYFISQVDSYQHHYLLFLLLLLCCFFPWERKDGDRAPSAWAVRLLLCQVSLLYLWAAVAKLDPLWLDGRTLSAQLRVDWIRGAVETVFGRASGPGDPGGFAALAKLLIVIEVFLALAIHVRRLLPAAVVVGVLFHAGVELAGFEIGLFSWFMFAVYLLVVPDRWVSAVSARAAPALEAMAGPWRRARAWLRGVKGWAALVPAALLLLLVPIERGLVAWVFVFAVVAAAVELARRRPAALAHLLACAALATLALSHPAPARDHYRYYAGSLRRLGDLEESTRVYERVTASWPRYAPGHTALGNLKRRQGQSAGALEHYERAHQLAPLDDRPLLGMALVYQATGRAGEAADAARRARWRAFLAAERGRERQAEAIVHRGGRS